LTINPLMTISDDEKIIGAFWDHAAKHSESLIPHILRFIDSIIET